MSSPIDNFCPLCHEDFKPIADDPYQVCSACMDKLNNESNCCFARIIDYTFCSECKERCGSAGVTDVLYTNEMV
jgi:hypothetical protein